jgi:uncharacterized protein
MAQLPLLAAVGAAAGLLGALAGVGGGIVIVPVLSLFLGVPIHQAIAASVVAVVATSTAAAISFVENETSNIRLGMTLETTTTIGAVVGGLAAAALRREILSAVFGIAMLGIAAYMLLRRSPAAERPDPSDPGTLGGSYHDAGLGRRVTYRVNRLGAGLTASFIAGNLSGMLGIGGGPVKVPAMTILMGVPMKAAAATSNFMIGVTACASAYLYYVRGFVAPGVAVPVAVGVVAGAFAGAKLASRLHGARITQVFSLVLVALAVQMLLSSVGIGLR